MIRGNHRVLVSILFIAILVGASSCTVKDHGFTGATVLPPSYYQAESTLPGLTTGSIATSGSYSVKPELPIPLSETRHEMKGKEFLVPLDSPVAILNSETDKNLDWKWKILEGHERIEELEPSSITGAKESYIFKAKSEGTVLIEISNAHTHTNPALARYIQVKLKLIKSPHKISATPVEVQKLIEGGTSPADQVQYSLKFLELPEGARVQSDCEAQVLFDDPNRTGYQFQLHETAFGQLVPKNGEKFQFKLSTEGKTIFLQVLNTGIPKRSAPARLEIECSNASFVREDQALSKGVFPLKLETVNKYSIAFRSQVTSVQREISLVDKPATPVELVVLDPAGAVAALPGVHIPLEITYTPKAGTAVMEELRSTFQCDQNSPAYSVAKEGSNGAHFYLNATQAACRFGPVASARSNGESIVGTTVAEITLRWREPVPDDVKELFVFGRKTSQIATSNPLGLILSNAADDTVIGYSNRLFVSGQSPVVFGTVTGENILNMKAWVQYGPNADLHTAPLQVSSNVLTWVTPVPKLSRAELGFAPYSNNYLADSYTVGCKPIKIIVENDLGQKFEFTQASTPVGTEIALIAGPLTSTFPQECTYRHNSISVPTNITNKWPFPSWIEPSESRGGMVQGLPLGGKKGIEAVLGSDLPLILGTTYQRHYLMGPHFGTYSSGFSPTVRSFFGFVDALNLHPVINSPANYRITVQGETCSPYQSPLSLPSLVNNGTTGVSTPANSNVESMGCEELPPFRGNLSGLTLPSSAQVNIKLNYNNRTDDLSEQFYINSVSQPTFQNPVFTTSVFGSIERTPALAQGGPSRWGNPDLQYAQQSFGFSSEYESSSVGKWQRSPGVFEKQKMILFGEYTAGAASPPSSIHLNIDTDTWPNSTEAPPAPIQCTDPVAHSLSIPGSSVNTAVSCQLPVVYEIGLKATVSTQGGSPVTMPMVPKVGINSGPKLGSIRWMNNASLTLSACMKHPTQQKVMCWGANRYGITGSPVMGPGQYQSTPQEVVIPNVTSIQDVDNSTDYACAIADQEIYCWGSNATKQTLSTQAWNIPTKISIPGRTFFKIKTFPEFACALESTALSPQAGSLYCWGKFANPLQTPAPQPFEVPELVTTSPVKPYIDASPEYRFKDFVADGYSFLGLTHDGQVVGWGYDQFAFAGANTVKPGTASECRGIDAAQVNQTAPVSLMGIATAGTWNDFTPASLVQTDIRNGKGLMTRYWIVATQNSDPTTKKSFGFYYPDVCTSNPANNKFRTHGIGEASSEGLVEDDPFFASHVYSYTLPNQTWFSGSSDSRVLLCLKSAPGQLSCKTNISYSQTVTFPAGEVIEEIMGRGSVAIVKTKDSGGNFHHYVHGVPRLIEHMLYEDHARPSFFWSGIFGNGDTFNIPVQVPGSLWLRQTMTPNDRIQF